MNFNNHHWRSAALLALTSGVIGVNSYAAPTTTNVALNKTTTVSSFNSSSTNGSKAVDGNTGTYWQTKSRSSLFAETITIDLGTTESISRVVLNWNTSYATTYDIEVSTNNSNYTKVHSVTGENGGIDTIDFSASSARYVRMYSRAWKNSRDRIRLNEMQVFRDDGLTPPPVSGSWSIISSPNASFTTELRDVAVVDANNIWAVGRGSQVNFVDATMIQQWNGSQWSIVPSPNPSTNGDALYGVSAISSSDAWAVGTANNRANRINELRAMTLRWDGSSWFEVPAVDIADVGEELRAVSTLSSTAAWAVGSTVALSTGARKPLIAFWNGNNWQVMPNPSVFSASEGGLLDVTAISTNDVWAVGYVTSVVAGSSVQTPLAIHWDGNAWSVVSLPNVETSFGGESLGATSLRSISVINANDIWAVGSTKTKTLTMHYDGSKWSVISSPNDLTKQQSYLLGVTAVSANDVWAVGLSNTSSVNSAGSPVQSEITTTIHWDGTKWSLIKSPNRDSHNFLCGVAKVNANDVWAVGNTADFYNAAKSMIQRYTAQ